MEMALPPGRVEPGRQDKVGQHGRPREPAATAEAAGLAGGHPGRRPGLHVLAGLARRALGFDRAVFQKQRHRIPE
jgi:hypothetical protein